MDLTNGSGARRGTNGRLSLARLALTLTLTATGCATRTAETRPQDTPTSLPNGLLEVGEIAPAIDADLAGRGRSSVDQAISPASNPDAEKADAEGNAGEPASEEEKDDRVAASPAGSTPPSIPEATPSHPIDLATALRLADGQNPVIGGARVAILGALAERTAARALLLPYLNAGFNYRDLNGPLQRSAGTILPVTLQSLYYGGGAVTVGGQTVAIPAVNIASPLTEAIFEPLAAQQRLVGARFNASATANSTLLDVAALHIELIGNQAVLTARRELAAEADRIAEGVTAFAVTGQGRRSDANRADADRRLFQAEIQRAEEEVAVTSARLAELLNLDPSSRLEPLSGPLEPITLIEPDAPAEALIVTAMARRPDLAARNALAMQAQYLVAKEKARPLLPTIWLGFSGGTFGGGSNITPPALGRYDGRTDFDIRAYWTLMNFGVGNSAMIRQRKAQFNQALAERSRVLNQIRDEVSSARAEALAFRTRVEVARQGVRTAEDGYRQDQARLRETLGRPIEALDSLRLLADARVALIRAITDANRAQFALFVSLGAPPPLEAPRAGLGPYMPPTSVPH